MLGSSEAGKGYWGRILWVDLTTGKIAVEEFEDTLFQKFLSGVGLGAKVLWGRLPAGADPLGPENILGFTTGLTKDSQGRLAGKKGFSATPPPLWRPARCPGTGQGNYRGFGSFN